MNWPTARGQVVQWTKDLADHPTFNGAMAQHYLAAHDPAKAQEYLEAYIRVAPDAWAYRSLADSYLSQNDEDRWLATLRKSLEQEDLALDHATTYCAIANHYLATGRPKLAVPYADNAAGSGAAWAMECAASAHGAVGDWDVAETLMLQDAQRYDTPMSYYQWCIRTGHGDVAKIREQATEKARVDTASGDRERITNAAVFYLFENDRAAALRTLHSTFDQTGEPWAGLWLALLADAAGDNAERDAALQKSATDGRQAKVYNVTRPWLSDTAAMLQSAFQAGGAKARIDPAAVDRINANIEAAETTNVDYFVGAFMLQHGQNDDGLALLRRVVTDGAQGKMTYLFASQLLRAHGEDPMALRQAADAKRAKKPA
jgi:hypothetical protein